MTSDDKETTVPDFLVAAMVITIFVCCALALRVAGGRTPRVVRVRRHPHRPNRAMMDL
ncbi:hypothetical protein [Nocardia spumae]|uniref:hypothetical protein n=1 Tax=Nocardia spumae TaxID=2887190 RepID=UPI001D14DCA7|nr:hypothetical protein [Nocardia spumae]